MKKAYIKPEAEKVEFDYSENVTASWEKWMTSNEWYTCDSSYKEANMVCGFNGKQISNPNYECGK